MMFVDAPTPSPTVGECLTWGASRLACDDGRTDAEALLCHLTGHSTAGLIARDQARLSADQSAAFQSSIKRRARGEPIAYITGSRAFWSLDLAVTPAVLIPRSETELLVERALVYARRHRAKNILELGTGSGAVALALAAELPHSAIVATDICPAALAVAEDNRRRVASQVKHLASVEFRLGNWFAATPAQRFNLIIANPPYIAPGDPHLQQGDVRFEPPTALQSPPDGLADLAQIIRTAPAHLTPGAILLLEHGYNQANKVRARFANHNFTAITTHPDLAGCQRVTEGRVTGSEVR